MVAVMMAPWAFRVNMDKFAGSESVSFKEDNGTYLSEKDMEDYK